MSRRFLMPWLFALALLIGQMGTLAHAASHFAKHDPGFPNNVCELCLAQANLGSAAASTPLLVIIPDATYHWYLPVADSVPETRPPVACARAPPAVV